MTAIERIFLIIAGVIVGLDSIIALGFYLYTRRKKEPSEIIKIGGMLLLVCVTMYLAIKITSLT